MAKLKSLLKIEGTLDGMTFYKGKDGYLVRTKGGVSKSRIENDPAFIRTRENGSEFGHLAKSGKVLRQALAPLLIEVKDTSITARVMKLMSQIKNTDTTSIRGSRNVATGLTTNEGKGFLKGFDFNANAKLSSVLLTEYQLNQTTGEISITNLNPLQQISIPGGATHVGFIAGVLSLDFATGQKELQWSPEVKVPINNTETTINAIPTSIPTGSGQTIYVFKIGFYQEINAVQYPLNNGTFNVLHIIEVL